MNASTSSSHDTTSTGSVSVASGAAISRRATPCKMKTLLAKHGRYWRKIHTYGLFHLYRLGTRLGVHVLPAHFYSPVPDIVELERTKDAWIRKSELPGIHVDLDEQVRNLTSVCLPYRSEYRDNRFRAESILNGYGRGFGSIEAQVLHSVVRHYRPRRIVEVGGGSSTYCSLKALELNRAEDGRGSELICIEPFPSAPLRRDERVRIIPEPVQRVGLDVFARLDRGDLLFVDSTHTVKPGGDVNYLVLEVLPRLKAGVVVHFHDIFLPYDYQPSVLNTMFHWCETSLLHAFLINNDRARILFCMSHLHYDREAAMRGLFPSYEPRKQENGLMKRKSLLRRGRQDFPTSLYFLMH